MISVVIPSRLEPYLKQTVEDLLKKAEGEIEIIVVLDGYWPIPEHIVESKKVRYLHIGETVGMRAAINAGIAIARYDYILKCDAHCMFDHGYDKKLLADMQKNFCVVPTEKRLDPDKWEVTDTHKPDINYMLLDDEYRGKRWEEKNRDESLTSAMIDNIIAFQGSCYLVEKSFFKSLGLLDDQHYGGSGHESQEIAFAYWLNGGLCLVNKHTWYAHWQRRPSKRPFDQVDEQKSRDYMKAFVEKNKAQIDKLIADFTGKNMQTPELKKNFFEVEPPKSPHKLENFKRRELVELFAQNGLKYGAEIGVRAGKFSEIMCQLIPDAKILSVDPYNVVYRDYRSIAMGEKKQEAYYKEATDRLAKYNCEIIRKTSLEAVRDIPYESLDFVYIDGSHEFDYVMTDLIEWSKRVRSGGIVSGHDYYNFHGGAVILAVDTYTKAHKIKAWFLTSDRTPSFWWVKP